MENFKFANDYIAQNNLQNTLQAIAIKEFAICLDSQVINKPVETTNEQPLYSNLEEWFKDQIEEIKDKYGYMQKHFTPMARIVNNDKIIMLFCGFELILLPDGTYILTDTTGG